MFELNMFTRKQRVLPKRCSVSHFSLEVQGHIVAGLKVRWADVPTEHVHLNREITSWRIR